VIQDLKDLRDAGLYCGPRLRKGEVFAYVGLPQNLKNLKERKHGLSTEPVSVSAYVGSRRT